MVGATTGYLEASFQRGADREAHRRAVLQHRENQERERKLKQDEHRNDASDMVDFAAAMITTEQANAFRTELDAYDTATIDALFANEAALDAINDQLEAVLLQAHVLEDGRRVFKTEDGTQVFDEFGHEVDADTLLPDEISDTRPTWEQFSDLLDRRETLQAERGDLLDYQAELDEARERLDSGEMTQDECDRLRERLADNAPEAVRARLGQDAPEQAAASPPQNIAAPVNLDADLAAMPTPCPFVPGN